MKKEIMRRNYEKTKLFNKNGVFSLEYDKETLRDMVLEYQEEIERLNNIINNDDVYGYIKHLEDLTAKKENIIKEAKDYIDKYLEREYFDTDILENNTIYNRDLFKVKQILEKEVN